MRVWGIVAVMFLALGAMASSQEVWLLAVEGEIGRGTVSYLRQGLGESQAAGAQAVVIEFATPGGLLDAATAARDLIMASAIPTFAYVNREAYSAGALLAIACERIYFAPGGVLGAATPVYFTGEEAPEKTISAVRALFRATAEARGRPPEVAEAMVDRDVAVVGLIEQGKLLTLTAQEAAAWGYADGEAEKLAELLRLEGLEGAALVRFSPRWVDTAVETLTTPWVSALLITLAVLGLIVEMLIPGFGAFGILGLVCLGLFFWVHFLVGLAGWESIVFLLGGLVAVLLEVFVFTATDFGVAGILGLILIGLGLYTAMVGPLTGADQALWAVGAVSGGLVVALGGTILLLTRLPVSRLRFGGVLLSSAITGRAFDRPAAQGPVSPWVGRVGVAGTDLRPVGAGLFGEERVDVVCEEGFLPKGTPIEVIKDEGYRKVVRRKEGE